MSESDTQQSGGVIVASEAGLAIRSMRDVMDVIEAWSFENGVVLLRDAVENSVGHGPEPRTKATRLAIPVAV